MVTVIDEGWKLSIPDYVTDIQGFRRWLDADDFPEEGRIWWLKGKVWADMSGEQIFTHNLLKLEIASTLRILVNTEKLGVMFTDGILLSNFQADISGKPDGLFVTKDTLHSDRIRLIEGKEHGYTEIQGAPDMVLEVLSDSSENKDEVVLKSAYWEAGVREYWLADVRGEAVRFDIFRHGTKGYTTARKQDGWVKSNVFGRAFRLLVVQSWTKYPDYKLDVR